MYISDYLFRSAVVFALIIFLLLSTTSLGAVRAQSEEMQRVESGVEVFVNGPTEIILNQSYTYNIEIGGTFADEANNWTVKSDSDLEATISPKKKDSNKSNTFEVNVTIHETGQATLTFKGYCGKENKIGYARSKLRVKVIKPAKTTFELSNPTDVKLENISVGLYIDGDLKNVTTVDSLEADGNKSLTLKWDREGLSEGKHKLVVRVDYGLSNSDSKFSRASSEKVLERTFYVEQKGNQLLYGWIAVISIIGFITFWFYLRRRKKKRRRPW